MQLVPPEDRTTDAGAEAEAETETRELDTCETLVPVPGAEKKNVCAIFNCCLQLSSLDSAMHCCQFCALFFVLQVIFIIRCIALHCIVFTVLTCTCI